MNFHSKIVAWFKKDDNIIYLEYALLTLLIMLPLLKPGYILTLDMIVTPKIRMPTEVGNSYLFGVFLHYLNYLIPSQIIQKVYLFLIIFLSGIGMHKLIPTKSDWPKYFAGILYIFNPFFYSRFIYGHVGLLLAYALTPFFLKAALSLFNNPTLKKAIKVWLLLALISVVSMHSILFVALLYGAFLLFFIIRKIKDRKTIAKVLGATLLIIALFIIFNSYWVLSFLQHETTASQIMAGFGKKQIVEFQTASDPSFGVMFNVAAMYGFWGDRELTRYILQKNIIPGWYVLFGIILALVIWGAVSNYRDKEKRWTINSLLLTGFIAFVLAVGIAHPITAKIFWFLVDNMFFFKGYRDAHKFVALLVFCYAYLGALGVDDVLGRIKRIKLEKLSSFLSRVVPALLLILVVAYSPLMLLGFAGQLRSLDYPKDWYQTNKLLNSNKAYFKVLVLPWHQYIWLDFTNKTIANPAKDFFDKPVIQGDNIEFGTIYTQTDNPTSRYIEKNVVFNPNPKNIGKKLKPLKIKYIILIKGGKDYPYYRFLDKQKDLKLIKDSKTLRVYLNKTF